MTEKVQLTIITGMSGAGKTVAIQAFEDMGYFAIDNMPPALLPKFLELLSETKNDEMKKIALVIDMRSRHFFSEMQELLNQLTDSPRLDFKLLFLDSENAELVARYKETRRSHPLATDGLVLDGIERERDILRPIKNFSQLVINTSEMTPRQLRTAILKEFSTEIVKQFRIELLSFGFKYGIPIDADMVMDVRFLPNPHYIPELRALNGQDKSVYDYVMKFPESEEFYQNFMNMLKPILPGYEKEGKSVLTIAIGCTGGQHRSVAFTERVGVELAKDWTVHIQHRDKNKRKETVNRS
ncbi:UPF0042 nucleotide-binding protein [Pilibacter termitis]|uniref:UPF0042 nucleotide-binding protein n=1 Tax=Pilibacter termitis TaxID=263852 RepID=A0A1T4KIZ5_9ENTE|nr:RNase adapter RapZ [Pilibacter termitis]SJZ42380.1 UPF0042 nucleotide-binding protein [Pilibacter termitis]